jgi:hypothetical protein
MKHTIDLSIDDINQIVVSDLKDAFSWNLDNQEAETELMNAIEVVLQYYMSPSEYSEWFQTRGRNDNQVLDSSYPDGDGYWK